MKKHFFKLAFLMSFISVKAQTFTCQVNQKDVLLGNYIEVEYTLKGAQNGQFAPPDMAGFDLVSGPNQSSSVSIVNGKMDASLTYSYYIEPRDTGTFVVPSASIRVGEKELSSEPIEIHVFENPDKIIEKPQPRRRPEFDIFGQPPGGEELPEPSIQPKKKRKTYRI